LPERRTKENALPTPEKKPKGSKKKKGGEGLTALRGDLQACAWGESKANNLGEGPFWMRKKGSLAIPQRGLLRLGDKGRNTVGLRGKQGRGEGSSSILERRGEGNG